MLCSQMRGTVARRAGLAGSVKGMRTRLPVARVPPSVQCMVGTLPTCPASVLSRMPVSAVNAHIGEPVGSTSVVLASAALAGA